MIALLSLTAMKCKRDKEDVRQVTTYACKKDCTEYGYNGTLTNRSTGKGMKWLFKTDLIAPNCTVNCSQYLGKFFSTDSGKFYGSYHVDSSQFGGLRVYPDNSSTYLFYPAYFEFSDKIQLMNMDFDAYEVSSMSINLKKTTLSYGDNEVAVGYVFDKYSSKNFNAIKRNLPNDTALNFSIPANVSLKLFFTRNGMTDTTVVTATKGQTVNKTFSY